MFRHHRVDSLINDMINSYMSKQTPVTIGSRAFPVATAVSSAGLNRVAPAETTAL